MNNLNVEMETLLNLSKKVREENEKLLEIVSTIIEINIDYQDMMISEAGNLFREVMIKEQESEKEKINLYNQEIADKLSVFSNIYSDTNEKIGELIK